MAGKTVTRVELCAAAYKTGKLSRSQSAEMVELVFREITDTLKKGEVVKLSSFGNFVVRKKKERLGRNPKTGKEALISPRRVVVFKPSAVMKQRVNSKPYTKTSEVGLSTSSPADALNASAASLMNR